jgi:acyl-CoA thioesterase YciA
LNERSGGYVQTSLRRKNIECSVKGKLVIQMVAMPCDTNSNGDIFGGWLMSIMDLASAYIAPKGKSATRAVNNIEFFKAVQVGDLVSCYGYVLSQGRTSVTVHVDVYVNDIIVACGDFVNVALNHNGRPVAIETK